MKNFFKSKGFIITSLVVLCIAILGVCWYISRDKNDSFLPNESPPASNTASDWSENGSQTGNGSGTSAHTSPQPTTPAEEYPKVVEESVDEVVIDFTDTEKSETTPPPAPEGKTVQEDTGPAHEVNPDPKVTTPEPQKPASNTPAAGSTNGNGAVYDPVFGPVVPGEGQQAVGDSDGDIDKMVGNMGE
ncbi:hypothetical protein DS742_17580 [Lacrimispora amygdalina]|uniref:Uncharacterized protein n=1 Tax=Lacrimispora amygdalina TaxID=253257 RepID=A0A3E2N9D1_9FIRM|nr:DUF6550 family protein [Clostridium indicum]RFZ77625.1 hypothetical protein DS742_17580 [Clostridium indicum]